MEIYSLIELFKKYTRPTKSIMEQEGESAPASAPSGGGAAAASSTGGSKYPTVTKWESGVTRGPANQVGNTKWSDIVKTTRGKANPIDTKSKWDSGVKRGKGNTLI
jgi:hypothetical protein